VIIWEIYGIMYGFAPLEHVFDPLLAAISFAVALLCSMGATYLACRSELRRPAAELIRPKAPKAGRRVFLEYVTPIWKRLSFLRKVSVRNVFRYRSRLVMMVLGIGGCTALLVTGFGIKDSIHSVVDDQYDKISLYDYSVTFQDPQTSETAAEYLSDRGWTADMGLLVHSGSIDVVTESGTKSVYLVASTTDSLDGFISLEADGEAIAYPGPGEAVVTTGLATALDIQPGQSIQLRDETLGTMTVTVASICENYVYNYVYISPQTYQEQLGQSPAYKTLYIQAHQDADPFAEGVTLSGDEVASVTVNESLRERVNSLLERLNYVVAIVVVCAGALAFIVLYNLTNINITERVREIATIKVLGFYQPEVASYVFREIVMLSAMGSLAGLLMGKALHAYVMAQIQIDAMTFPCRVNASSYLLSIALTMVFTIIITWFMRPKLRRVDMAESLKSIE
jgi:putative ABC transport system permease protein